jgi:BirA family transcriptional regulator, biotin operon repressor / biotin---[acetyl-CoA-carboxylase] ligase
MAPEPAALTFRQLVEEVRQHRNGVPLNVLLLRRVDSTNRLARRIRAELGLDELTLPWSALLAFEQTAGRGRLGRRWESPPGQGIYLTVLGRLPDRDRLAVLPLAVAACVAETLAPHLRERPRLKWPNDLTARGRKLGGVLVEAMSGGEGSPAEVLVGLGVNHGQAAAELPTAGSTSLAMLGTVRPLGELALVLAAAIGEELQRREPHAKTIERWLAHSQHEVGDELRCRLPATRDGERVVTGTFRGLTGDGRLRLEVAGREELLVSAEVESP